MTVLETLYEGYGWRMLLEQASLPDGRQKKDVRAYRADSVCVIAVDDKNRVLLLKEYRPFLKRHVWILPSGRVDKETDIRIAAQRELQEEAGMRAEEINFFFSLIYGESAAWKIHVFIAKSLIVDPLPQDEDELIEVHALPLDEAIKNVLSENEVIASSALALLRYQRDHL